MNTSKGAATRQGQATRKTGWEWKAAGWATRHPLFTALPTAAGLGALEFGATPTGLAAGGVAAGMGAWYRAHPSSFDATVGPWLRAQRRRWTTYLGPRWRHKLDACDLVKVHNRTGEVLVPRVVRVRSASVSIDTLTVRMVPGQTPTLFADQAETLAHALGAERIAVSAIRPGYLALVVEWRNPFDYTVPAPLIPDSAAEVDLRALPVGEDEFGQPYTIRVEGRTLLVAGTMGSGKSGLVWSPLRAMGPAIRDGLVRVRMIDLKGGMETERGRPLFHRWAANVDDAMALLTEFRDDMRARQAQLKAAGKRKATVSRETPLELLQIDELAMLSAYADRSSVREAMALLGEIQTQGRAALFSVAAYVQEPSKDIVDTRDLFTDRICLAVTSDRHPDMVLGDGARDRGALADHIPLGEDHAGIGFVVEQHSRRPRRIRAGHVTDADIDELVRTCTPNPAPTSADLKVVV
jgi:S-DNA-T family DNA segregation ATPase FtsK/SpoIIIE